MTSGSTSARRGRCCSRSRLAARAPQEVGLLQVVHGVAAGEWRREPFPRPATKAELIALWDQTTAAIQAAFPTILPHRFSEVDKAFGMWEGTGIASILYAIDNEIHHRGQAYVYLRALGIAPPAFPDRS